jgi:hypothetical protein
MAIDYSVHFECDVKLTLGDGDLIVGEGALLHMLKCRNRAKDLEKIAKQQGKDVKTMKMKVNETGEDGQWVTTDVTYPELASEAEPLAELESACTNCPANALGRAFGCQGATKYPIRKQAEEWLMEQVQTADTVAGPYFVLAMKDGEEGLARVCGMRSDGLFESREPVCRDIGGRRSPGMDIDSNSVFELFMGRGDLLDPNYCVMILMGLAAISLDGQPAVSEQAFGTLLEMEDVGERRRRTSFAFRPSADPNVVGLQALLRAMYFAWRNGVPFLISS